MSDPQTSNILLNVPTRGSDVGTWDTPCNANYNSVDGRFGGNVVLTLSNVPVTLSKPTGTASPGSGPTQAENAMLNLNGTLSGNVVLTFSLPGVYLIYNSCTVGSFYVQVRAAGTGLIQGLPDGKASKIWCDGSSILLADQPEVGSYLDLALSTTPNWFAACSTLPWLICDGSTYSVATYPFLGARLGSTFGGNGSTTFGVPDLRARTRIPLDNMGSGAANRITFPVAGITGTLLGASGGSQTPAMPAHSHTATDPGHQHNAAVFVGAGAGNTANPNTAFPASANGIGTIYNNTSNNTFNANHIATAVTGITLTSTSSVVSGNIQPGLVAGITLVKT